MTVARRTGSRVRSIVLVVALGAIVTALTAGWWTTTPQGSADTSTTSTTSVAATTTTIGLPTTTVSLPVSPLPWPSAGIAAIAVPQASVAANSPHQGARPIASLTKMMTAWVVLSHIPLSVGQQGPCIRVDAHDVGVYEHDVATGQSSVDVKAGERLCENTLLDGLLVHSAGNYANIFLRLLGFSMSKFVAQMNADAVALGMSHTHYVDITGIGPGDRSTARDQATLAADLMGTQAIVRHIVVMPRVFLPVAGNVISYTPFVGSNGVVGVKSGYTVPAGGCDAMAVRFSLSGVTITAYAVVIGQPGGDSINHAGQIALSLVHSLRHYLAVHSTPTGKVVVWTGQPGDVVTTTTTTTTTIPVPTSTTTGP
jgi:D-alanyl-D-alanine carboxypeptidase (penicillin-binding protein 5/6)